MDVASHLATVNPTAVGTAATDRSVSEPSAACNVVSDAVSYRMR